MNLIYLPLRKEIKYKRTEIKDSKTLKDVKERELKKKQTCSKNDETKEWR